MALPSGSCLLTELSWIDVADHIVRDSRLIVPIGACDQYGPHLPIGAGTLVAEKVAETLGRDFGVLRAPTLQYGVNLPTDRSFAGTAGVNEKSLHRVLNDLLAGWEAQGFTEFVLITAHRYDPHIDALATATGNIARVRAVEVLGMDYSELRQGAPGHELGGEILTSLMLHLYPERVDLTRAVDFTLPVQGPRARRLNRLPPESPGCIGMPSLASAEKGRLAFDLILQRVRTKVFLATEEDD